MVFLSFVKAALPKQIIDIIDPLLFLWKSEGGEATMIDITHNEGQNGSPIIQDCLIVILGIGVACSVELPRERMNMSAVIIELHSIRKKLLETNLHNVFKAQVNFYLFIYFLCGLNVRMGHLYGD